MLNGEVSLFLEKRLPALIAGGCFVACVTLKSSIVSSFINEGLSLPQLYTAIFGWASIMTGFLFGVYSLIVSKSDGFIHDAMNTNAMSQFLSYTVTATIMGFVLTIFGMALLVMNVEMKDISNIMFVIGSIYFAMFIYSFLATMRVAYIFAIIVRVRPRIRMPG